MRMHPQDIRTLTIVGHRRPPTHVFAFVVRVLAGSHVDQFHLTLAKRWLATPGCLTPAERATLAPLVASWTGTTFDGRVHLKH